MTAIVPSWEQHKKQSRSEPGSFSNLITPIKGEVNTVHRAHSFSELGEDHIK
jgi:hypothetical protein